MDHNFKKVHNYLTKSIVMAVIALTEELVLIGVKTGAFILLEMNTFQCIFNSRF